MVLYFSAENDAVPMGRYPIIVDPSTQTTPLHVVLTNVPSSPPNLNLVFKGDNGITIGNPIPLPAGTAKYDNTFTFTLPDAYSYFRYEIQSASSGNRLAFSQPLIFNKTTSAIFPGFWTALVPQDSAALDLPVNSISFTNNVLTEQVKVRLPQGDGKTATVKIFIPSGMFASDQFVSSPAGTFDPNSRILTVNTQVTTANPRTITVSPSQGILSAQAVDESTQAVEESPSLQASIFITWSSRSKQ